METLTTATRHSDTEKGNHLEIQHIKTNTADSVLLSGMTYKGRCDIPHAAQPSVERFLYINKRLLLKRETDQEAKDVNPALCFLFYPKHVYFAIY